MNDKLKMMPAPGMVGQGVQVDISQATPKNCENCNAEIFLPCVRMGILSAMAPSNPTGKDIPIKYEVYICGNCNHEFGKPVLKDGKADAKLN